MHVRAEGGVPSFERLKTTAVGETPQANSLFPLARGCAHILKMLFETPSGFQGKCSPKYLYSTVFMYMLLQYNPNLYTFNLCHFRLVEMGQVKLKPTRCPYGKQQPLTALSTVNLSNPLLNLYGLVAIIGSCGCEFHSLTIKPPLETDNTHTPCNILLFFPSFTLF